MACGYQVKLQVIFLSKFLKKTSVFAVTHGTTFVSFLQKQLPLIRNQIRKNRFNCG